MLKNDKRIFIGSLLGIFILYNFLLPQTLLFAFDFSAEFRSAGQRARVLAGIERLEMVVPEDTTGTVRLGFARLSSGDSPVEQRTAAAVSERLRQIMPAELPVRSLTVIEQQGIQRRLLKERRQSVINSINDANRKLDELLFAYDLDDKARKNQADDLQQEINLLREKLQTWEEVPLSYINVLTERQTELIELSGQSLFPAYEPVKAFPDKADILIGGSVRTIGGYLEVDIRLYSRFAQDTIPEGESIFRDVIREEDMAEEVAQMAFRTVEAISARPLAMTRFIVEGDDQAVL
ncbi:MAG: hypothetical protein D6B26_04800, partial [Spirochaetaceae bacterium]